MNVSLATISSRYDQVFVRCGSAEFSQLLSQMDECRRQIEIEFAKNPLALVASRLCHAQRLLVRATQIKSSSITVQRQYDQLFEIAELFSHLPLHELEIGLRELQESTRDFAQRKAAFDSMLLGLRRLVMSIESAEEQ